MKKIDVEYFEWLVSQIEVPPTKTFYDLFELMHNLAFVWIVPNDDNRVQDGLDLRYEFNNDVRRGLILDGLDGVSMLEILVSLSRRVAFTAGGKAPTWAWKLIKNIGLNRAADPLTNGKAKRVEDVFDALIWRTYQRDGTGGFFPLRNPQEDQTTVEIWYQMNSYVNEIAEL